MSRPMPAREVCTACEGSGVQWYFTRSEDRNNPQHGTTYNCADCDGRGYLNSTENDMNNKWFLVLSAHGDNSYQLAYQSREHAEAVAKVKTIEYPAVGPYRVIELAEVMVEQTRIAA